MKTSYFCVKCKMAGCGYIPLLEFNPELHLKLRDLQAFKAVHAKCGLEFIYEPEDVDRKDLDHVPDFTPNPALVAVLVPRTSN